MLDLPNDATPAQIAAAIRDAHDAAERDRALAAHARNATHLPTSGRRGIARMLENAAAEWDALESRLFNRLYA